MEALLNAHIAQGCESQHHIGFISNVLPEAQSSKTGVSSEYVPQEGYNWYVLRVTYNRIKVAQTKISNAGIKTYVPMHYVVKVGADKRMRISQPLLPNILFIYTTRKKADSIVKRGSNAPSFIKYYLDKTLPPEGNGKNPPLTIPYNAMINFIRATSTNNEHVRVVSAEQCHYKSGDTVRVIAGDFKGITGKVARIAGQQRVVVELSGFCLVATAYIPTDFIENLTNREKV